MTRLLPTLLATACLVVLVQGTFLSPARVARAFDIVVGPLCQETASSTVQLVEAEPPPMWRHPLLTGAYFQFAPSASYVAFGTNVTWVNDGHDHTVTSNDTDPVTGRRYFDYSFAADPENPNATFSVLFCQAGLFNYHCRQHNLSSNMVGYVDVS